MNIILIVIVIIAQLCCTICAHPAVYPHVQARLERSGSKSWTDHKSADDDMPGILSWHVHAVYPWNQVNESYVLRAKAQKHFQQYFGDTPECPTDPETSGYDHNYLCYEQVWNETSGPFPVGEWDFFVPTPYFSLVMPWFMQHRGNISIFIHPNTGWEYNDHKDWGSWTGDSYPLVVSIFEAGKQTNEFGHKRGDSDNPVCMPDRTVCGDSTSNVTVTCCSGLVCAPDTTATASSPVRAAHGVDLWYCISPKSEKKAMYT